MRFAIFTGVLALLIASGLYLISGNTVASQVQETFFVNTADPAIEAGFVPHKALYDISLISTKSGSQIVNIAGQMLYEWKSNCDAWNTKHKFNLTYEYADSPAMAIVSDFSTYEPFDGQSLNFTAQRKRDGRVFEEVRGYADANQAIFNIPQGIEYNLPEGTLFPMHHTLQVLKHIKSGKKLFKATIFDGSDEDGPVEINAFLGQRSAVDKALLNNKKIDKTLLDNDAWKIRLGFFPIFQEEATADYEMSLIFHDNGIISDMIVDYKDFSIRQKLIALEQLESSCELPQEKQEQ